MPSCPPSPVDAWVAQLQSADTRALIDLAAKQKRRVQVVLFVDDKGKIAVAKVTAS